MGLFFSLLYPVRSPIFCGKVNWGASFPTYERHIDEDILAG